MKLIAIYRDPEDTYSEIDLDIIKVDDFNYDTVSDTIKNRYDVDNDTFHYYEPGIYFDGNGQYTTVDDEEIELRWLFETREID